MNIIFAAVALATAQAAPAAPVDHSQHNAAQHAQQQRGLHQQGQQPGPHAQHDGEHKCCKEVNGKMECQMMKGHSAPNQGQGAKQDHQGHGSSH